MCNNAEDCEQYSSNNICCTCRNREWHRLYKEYKAKEQECERLKEYFEIAKEASNCNLKALGEMTEWADKLDEENDQLKAENDELKEEIAKVRMEICNECGERTDYNIPCKQIRDLDYGLQLEIEENNKLKQTLTEIKEIINDFAKQDIITFPDFEPKRNYDFIQKQCGEPIIQILQKISECEVNDE